MSTAELEINLALADHGDYEVSMRCRLPAVDMALVQGKAKIDFNVLDEAWSGDPTTAAYAQALTRQLFAQAELLSYFENAWRTVHDAPLRIRLFLDPTAPRLHNLRWELLLNPVTNQPLAEGPETPFSRYLNSQYWRSPTLRPKGELRALVVVAGPNDLNHWGLGTVHSSEEVAWAEDTLKGILLQPISGPDTLQQMTEQLVLLSQLRPLFKPSRRQAISSFPMVQPGRLVAP
jgi:hypothetical protein